MNWKPLGDKVIVRKMEDSETKTNSGIVLIGTDPNEKHVEAEVVAVGSGKWENGHLIPMDVEVGDIVLHHKHYGTDISPDNPADKAEYMILHGEDITGIVQK